MWHVARAFVGGPAALRPRSHRVGRVVMSIAPPEAELSSAAAAAFDHATVEAKWQSYWDASVVVPCGPAAKDQPAPLDTIPVFKRM